MTSINELLSAVEGSSKVVTLAANEYFDFNAKDQAVVIEQGELLVVGQKDPKTGRAGRQLFKEADPVGVAESIASRVSDFDFSVNTDMRLRVFDGALMRSHVNKAGVFARTIATTASNASLRTLKKMQKPASFLRMSSFTKTTKICEVWNLPRKRRFLRPGPSRTKCTSLKKVR